MNADTKFYLGAGALVLVLLLVLRGSGASGARVTASTLQVTGGGDPVRTNALTSIFGQALGGFSSERLAGIQARNALELGKLATDRDRIAADTALRIAREQRGAARDQSIINGVTSVLTSPFKLFGLF